MLYESHFLFVDEHARLSTQCFVQICAGVVGKREYRDSSVDSSSDDDRTVSTAASASSPNKHMRHRTDPSKSSDFRLKYDHADSQYHNKHDRNDRRDIRASAPVGPWSPTDDYEHHSADDNIQCRARK